MHRTSRLFPIAVALLFAGSLHVIADEIDPTDGLLSDQRAVDAYLNDNLNRCRAGELVSPPKTLDPGVAIRARAMCKAAVVRSYLPHRTQ
jgi:hypothetical protein